MGKWISKSYEPATDLFISIRESWTNPQRKMLLCTSAISGWEQSYKLKMVVLRWLQVQRYSTESTASARMSNCHYTSVLMSTSRSEFRSVQQMTANIRWQWLFHVEPCISTDGRPIYLLRCKATEVWSLESVLSLFFSYKIKIHSNSINLRNKALQDMKI